MTDRTLYLETLAGLRRDLEETRAKTATLAARLTESQARETKLTNAVSSLAEVLGESANGNGSDSRPTVETPQAAPPLPTVRPPTQGPASDTTEYPTIAEAGERALSALGRHTRAEPIARQMLAMGLADPKGDFKRLQASVGAVLGRRASENNVFTRPRTGLFGLIVWNGRGPNETQEQLSSSIAEKVDDDEMDTDLLEYNSADHAEAQPAE